MFPVFHFEFTHKYRISFDKRPRRLSNVKALKGGTYYRAALKRGRRLF